MNYMGGKWRQSKMLTEKIGEREGEGFKYWEPFCGAMWSAVRIIENLHPSSVVLSDVNKSLILLWNGLINGTVALPPIITKEDYDRYKKTRDMNDPLTAWYGFNCSFGGMWFSSMANQESHRATYSSDGSTASTTRKVRILKTCHGLSIVESDYLTMLEHKPSGMVIYCDPPYEDRAKVHCFDSFDYPLFWDNIRRLSKDNHVYTTCFKHPEDFEVIHDWGCTIVNMHSSKHEIKHGSPTEKLVIYKGGNLS